MAKPPASFHGTGRLPTRCPAKFAKCTSTNTLNIDGAVSTATTQEAAICAGCCGYSAWFTSVSGIDAVVPSTSLTWRPCQSHDEGTASSWQTAVLDIELVKTVCAAPYLKRADSS